MAMDRLKAAAKSATKTATKTMSAKTMSMGGTMTGDSHKPQGKRERIDTTPGKPGGSRFVRRDAHGRFTSDQVDVGRSLARDNDQQAKTVSKPGFGDRGDRRAA